MRNAFPTVGLITIVAVYFLIMVGGVVRASGAGMGCPDWPKCFGQWVPPTDVSQLPENYQEIYKDHGYGNAPFNAVKTWTEYINRLIGVSIGFLIFLTVVCASGYWRDKRTIFWLSLAAFLLVGFEGWLGSVVVASNLNPWIITVHMLVALIIVGLLITARAAVSTHDPDQPYHPLLGKVLLTCLVLSFFQIALGTHVREAVDVIALDLGPDRRSEWIGEIGISALVHRSFSIVILFTNAAAIVLLRRNGPIPNSVAWAGYGVAACIVAEIGVGAIMFYAAIPAVLQPVHLVLASVMAGLQWYLWIISRSVAPEMVGTIERKAATI
jgi:cytochrome c oxidase assembly protein subunit 15